MPNVVFVGFKGVQVNAARGTHLTFDNTTGVAQIDSADTGLVDEIEAQGAVRTDVEGAEEALTAGTVQTATTLRGLSIRNGAGASVINVRVAAVGGAILVGPLDLAAGLERLIIFPTALTATGGVYVQVVSGALHATPGFLIP